MLSLSETKYQLTTVSPYKSNIYFQKRSLCPRPLLFLPFTCTCFASEKKYDIMLYMLNLDALVVKSN